jgi:hypothetical protein
MWRKSKEACKPELAGEGTYSHQVPAGRAVPMWGGISEGGFSVILFHDNKKLTSDDWVESVEDDDVLVNAIKRLGPVHAKGPWHVLCDNETFLHTQQSRAAYKALKVKTWRIPPRSPDLNPIEKFWSWLRRHLRSLDLKDLQTKRPPMSVEAYRARIRQVCSSNKANNVARADARGLRKVCAEVVQKKGAASRG